MKPTEAPPSPRPANARIAVARIYDAPGPEDGARVLIMRLWPRGVRKERVDHWLRELGPEVSLMRGFLSGAIPWPDYVERYRAGLDRPEARAALAEVRRLARDGRVTLLCWCADEHRCHRSLLRDHLLEGVV